MKRDNYLEKLLGKPIFDYEKFHPKTKFSKLNKNADRRFWPKEWKTVFYKGYARLPEIKLPKPELPNVTIKDALGNRESIRKFSRKPVDLKKLSSFLYYSAGINPKHNFKERRFYPSGGARFPLEVYVISQNTKLTQGIYHYYVKNNSLEYLADFDKEAVKKITSLPWARQAACLIIITTIFKRNTNKYGERGYRFILEEAGHLAQNFYLLASALNLGMCAIGDYIDDYVNGLIDVNSSEETVIYLAAVGQRSERKK